MKRLSPRKVLLYLLFGLLAICLAAGASVYVTLPYGLAEEMGQVLSELLAQRLIPATPQPVSFPAELPLASAQFANQVELGRMMADLTWLADDTRQGRQAGSSSENEVGAWLIDRLNTLGLRPLTEAGLDQWAQSFNSANGEQAENIVAVLPGTGEPARYVLVGAHYDHLGIAVDGQVYNGADDDGTGVSAVLEVARILSTAASRPQETIVFVLFSGEEGGRRGSSALGKLLRARGLAQQCQFLNLEVLGAVRGSELYLNVWDEDSRSTSGLVAAVQVVGQELKIPLKNRGRDPSSDATRMLAYGVPSVTLDTAWGKDTHPHNHTPQDDVAAIDPQGLLIATRAAVASVWLLANDGQ